MNQRATPTPPAAAPETPQTKRVKDPTPGGSGQTTPHLNEGLAPRMPHERDESSDSQAAAPQPIIEQARRDVERGLVDTDRGPVLDDLYENDLRPQTEEGRAAEPRGQNADTPTPAGKKLRRIKRPQ
jgi:hypothetical protein